MPIPRPALGVTLIEVLVVLVILSVVSGILVLSIGSADGNARVRQEALRLAERMDYACERAELSGRTIGLTVNVDGYGFMRAEGDRWQLETDTSLRQFKLPKGLELADGNVRSGRDRQLGPSVFCFASGERSPFELTLRAGPNDDVYRLRDQWPKPTRIERRPAQGSTWQVVES